MLLIIYADPAIVFQDVVSYSDILLLINDCVHVHVPGNSAMRIFYQCVKTYMY